MDQLAPGMKLADRYHLLRRLPSSGRHEAWQACFTDGAGRARTCTVKLGSEPFTLRFVQEAMSVARLQHGNLLRVIELSHDPEAWFAAVEYVDGADLGALTARLRQRGQHVPEALVLHLVAEVLRGLGHAHEARDIDGNPLGIVHRGVRPSSIHIARQTGAVKLGDFAMTGSAPPSGPIPSGQLAYLAPEQWRGEPADARSDIYAVGRVLLELLAGQLPSDPRPGARPRITLPLPVREVRPELAAIVHRALAADPAQRFASARAMLAALEPHLAAKGADLGALVQEVMPPADLPTERVRMMDARLLYVMQPSRFTVRPTIPVRRAG